MTKKSSKPKEENKRLGAPCEIQGFPPNAPMGAEIILGGKTVIIITDDLRLRRMLSRQKNLPQ